MLDLKRPPTAPGAMLLEEFMRLADLTQVEAGRRMKMPLNRLNEIIYGKRAFTAHVLRSWPLTGRPCVNVAPVSTRDRDNPEARRALILDDTVTSGHSLAAARHRLTEAGAKRVAAVGLGRTLKYFSR